ncbi:hypothetical protein ACTMSW_00160 [Micromonospora sp. BQ11]|uniref:hypothetical protein n=1 Tax=Micromonospora sp. BQ11 TaxID=3452212 RepID=UPI003F897F70
MPLHHNNRFTPQSLLSASPKRAALMLRLLTDQGEIVVLQDSHNSEFMRPPALQPSRERNVLSLSRNGKLVLGSQYYSERATVWIHDLASGQEKSFDLDGAGPVVHAAATINGRLISVLSEQADPDDPDVSVISVHLIEVEQGHESVLFTSPGGASAETSLGLSPSQRFIAATYEASLEDEPEEGELRLVILSSEGERLQSLHACAVPGGNTAWVSDTEVCFVGEVFNHDGKEVLSVLDVLSGQSRELAAVADRPRARIGEWFIVNEPEPSGGGPSLAISQLSQDERQPFLEIPAPCMIVAIEVADMT